MLLEEYGPTFEHIQGTKNVVADALSRLDMQTKVQDTQMDTEPSTQLSYLTEEDIIEESFPMSPKEIYQHQRKDKTLENKITQDKEYNYKKIEGKNLIHYRNKIYVPEHTVTMRDVLVSHVSHASRRNTNVKNYTGHYVLA